MISIICTFFVTSLILSGVMAWLSNQVEYRFEPGDIDDEYGLFRSAMMWKRHGKSRWQLVYGYVVNDRLGVSYLAKVGRKESRGSSGAGRALGVVDIKMTPDQLLVNGVELHPTPDAQVFVLTEPNAHVPIKLDPQELVLFQPDVYPVSLQGSDVWANKFRRLVDSRAIQRDIKDKLLQEEEAWNSVRSKLGIQRVSVYDHFDNDTNFGRDLFYHAEFDGYPNDTYRLANAFFTYRTQVCMTRHHSSENNYHDVDAEWAKVSGQKRVYLRPFPAFFKINGQIMERNKVFVQKPDGTIESLHLTDSEYRQLTHEAFSSMNALIATEVFRNRIAPAIGAPVEVP